MARAYRPNLDGSWLKVYPLSRTERAILRCWPPASHAEPAGGRPTPAPI